MTSRRPDGLNGVSTEYWAVQASPYVYLLVLVRTSHPGSAVLPGAEAQHANPLR
jgi:hypothetical protein